jgi:hypothetical protein
MSEPPPGRFKTRTEVGTKLAVERGALEALRFGEISTGQLPEGDGELASAWTALEAAYEETRRRAAEVEALVAIPPGGRVITPRELLDMPIPENNSGARTVRAYLVKLLARVWEEEQGFDGKRPFGDSGWQTDVYVPMVHAGLISGEFFEDGFYIKELDERAGCQLMLAAIAALGEQ